MKLAVIVTILVVGVIVALVVLRIFSGWQLQPRWTPPLNPGSSATATVNL